VREQFAREGEAEFRRRERALLEETFAREPLVVATGGGTLADAAVLEAARRRGAVVWLHPAFETLVRRIGPLGKADRPLFRDEASALALYRERLRFYRAADLVVDVRADETPEEIVERIRLGLRLPEAACSI
jgi:shikimate kinase